MARKVTTAEQYLRQARVNWEFLSFLAKDRPKQYDWIITVQYYFIIHLIKAHLMDQGIRAGYHSEVKDAIDQRYTQDTFLLFPLGQGQTLVNRGKKEITLEIKYLKLETLSRRARYLGIDGYHQPVNAVTLKESLTETAIILSHYRNNHPKITQHPFNQLMQLPPLTFINPNAPVWTAPNGLFSILPQ